MCTVLIDGLGHETWSMAVCRCLLPERSRFSQISHIIFRVLVALKTSVPYACRFVACSSRIKVDRQTDRHTDGQTTKYRNPRCAFAPGVNNDESAQPTSHLIVTRHFPFLRVESGYKTSISEAKVTMNRLRYQTLT